MLRMGTAGNSGETRIARSSNAAAAGLAPTRDRDTQTRQRRAWFSITASPSAAAIRLKLLAHHSSPPRELHAHLQQLGLSKAPL